MTTENLIVELMKLSSSISYILHGQGTYWLLNTYFYNFIEGGG